MTTKEDIKGNERGRCKDCSCNGFISDWENGLFHCIFCGHAATSHELVGPMYSTDDKMPPPGLQHNQAYKNPENQKDSSACISKYVSSTKEQHSLYQPSWSTGQSPSLSQLAMQVHSAGLGKQAALSSQLCRSSTAQTQDHVNRQSQLNEQIQSPGSSMQVKGKIQQCSSKMSLSTNSAEAPILAHNTSSKSKRLCRRPKKRYSRIAYPCEMPAMEEELKTAMTEGNYDMYYIFKQKCVKYLLRVCNGWPTPIEYREFCRSVVETFPFLKFNSADSEPFEHFKTDIVTCIRNQRYYDKRKRLKVDRIRNLYETQPTIQPEKCSSRILYPCEMPAMEDELMTAMAEGNYDKYYRFKQKCVKHLLRVCNGRPTPVEYREFCKSVVETFPFLKFDSPDNEPFEHFKSDIMTCIRNQRHYNKSKNIKADRKRYSYEIETQPATQPEVITQ